MPTHRSSSRKRTGHGQDAIAVLKADHQRVRRLLGELEKTRDDAASKRKKLLATIEAELEVHTRIEEELFYPAFRELVRKSDDRELYYEAIEEHHVVDLVLPEIKDADPGLGSVCGQGEGPEDLVEHHAEEEESDGPDPREPRPADREFR